MEDIYSLSDYGRMVADRARMDAYAYALKAAVHPGSVVLDIGCGTGIHALLACKFGARRVFAVEPDDAIVLARQIAADNGFADRIDFIQDMSTQVTLPERADVIVSDLRGQLPFFGEHIPSVVDARLRHLAPGGALIPARDTLFVALVAARDVYDDIVRPWDEPYGLNMSAARRMAVNGWTSDGTDEITARSLLTEPQLWLELDYLAVEDPDAKGRTIEARACRSGTAHGLLVWFDAVLAEDIRYGNGPGSTSATEVYGRGFFPLEQPVKVDEGDLVTMQLRAELSGGDSGCREYDWSWGTKIEGAQAGVGGAEAGVKAGVKADYDQSTRDATASK